jgi:hypothetical protein
VFRRRVGLFRPRFGRPRLLGAALIGGLGFAAGRASKPSIPPTPAPEPELTGRLKGLADMHAAGALNDDEFAAAKRKLLEP